MPSGLVSELAHINYVESVIHVYMRADVPAVRHANLYMRADVPAVQHANLYADVCSEICSMVSYDSDTFACKLYNQSEHDLLELDTDFYGSANSFAYTCRRGTYANLQAIYLRLHVHKSWKIFRCIISMKR